MKTDLEILHIEDSDDDGLLVKNVLKALEQNIYIERVDSKSALEHALVRNSWDLVISDYNVPGLDFEDVLSLTQAADSLRPMILVSGTMGEEAAVDMMRMGVHDLVVKENLKRLPAVVVRNLREAQTRIEKNNAQKLLRESQHRYATLWENSTTGYLLISSGHIVDCNQTLCNMWQLNKDALVSQPVAHYINSPKAEAIVDFENAGNFPQSDVNEEKTSFHYRHHLDEATELFCEVTLNRIAISDRWLCVAAIRDVTQRVRDQELLLLQDRALQCVNNGITIARYEGVDNPIIWVNNAFLRMTGYTNSEILGQDCRFLNEPDRDQKGVSTLREAVINGKSASVQIRNFRKDGSMFWNQLRIDPVFNNNGELTHYVSVARDVTDEVEAQAKLKRSETLLSESGQVAQVGGWELNLETNDIYWSAMTREIHGVGSDYAVTFEKAIAFYHPEDRTRVERYVEGAINQCEDFDFEARIITLDGEKLWVRVIGKVNLENGECIRICGAFQDITKQKADEQKQQELSKQVLQLQKLETIGTLAGGVAHDFNNILGAIRGWSELAERHVAGNAKAEDDIKHVLQAVERARELVSQILLFSRETEISRVPLDPAEVITEALHMLRSTLPTTVELRIEIDEAIGSILADASQIQQVVMNLCTNALQALPDNRGWIGVKLSQEVMTPDTQDNESAAPVPMMYLSISDNGTGIPKAQQLRIFEPFFTTKPVGEGTGLGLSVVHGIVHAHHGTITVESKENAGTTFHVMIPLLEKDIKQTSQDRDSQIQEGAERILLVDDEIEMTEALSRNLTDFGYTVTAFNHSSEAKNVFLKRPANFDILITDQIMPSLTGLELAHALRQESPDLPVILMTGYSQNLNVTKSKLPPNTIVLLKPYTSAAITAAIRSLCDHTA